MLVANIGLLAVSILDFAWDAVSLQLPSNSQNCSRSRFISYPPSSIECEYPQLLTNSPFKGNPAFWLKDFDFSCVSPWNDQSGNRRAGTAISKRHVIFATHFPIAVGSRILFSDHDGNVCPCYIKATRDIPNADLTVGLLNADLTPNIQPAKLLPDDYQKYIGDGDGLPVVIFNQHKGVSLTELCSISTNRQRVAIGCRIPKRESAKRFYNPLKVGDSGNPAFLLLGKTPVLLFTVTTGGAGVGPAIHKCKYAIQKTMDELCPGHQLEFADLSRRD